MINRIPIASSRLRGLNSVHINKITIIANIKHAITLTVLFFILNKFFIFIKLLVDIFNSISKDIVLLSNQLVDQNNYMIVR